MAVGNSTTSSGALVKTSVTLTHDQLALLDQLSEEAHVSRSVMLRQLLVTGARHWPRSGSTQSDAPLAASA